MGNRVNLQCNRFIHLENSMVMNGVYNAETLEKLISSIHQMLNITTPNERLFVSKLGTLFTWYVNKNGFHHFAINTLIYLRPLREKYIKIYEEFITQLLMYTKAI